MDWIPQLSDAAWNAIATISTGVVTAVLGYWARGRHSDIRLRELEIQAEQEAHHNQVAIAEKEGNAAQALIDSLVQKYSDLMARAEEAQERFQAKLEAKDRDIDALQDLVNELKTKLAVTEQKLEYKSAECSRCYAREKALKSKYDLWVVNCQTCPGRDVRPEESPPTEEQDEQQSNG